MTANQINYIKAQRDREVEAAKAAETARSNFAKEDIDRKYKKADIDVRNQNLEVTKRGQDMRLGGEVIKAVPKYLQALKPNLLDVVGGGD